MSASIAFGRIARISKEFERSPKWYINRTPSRRLFMVIFTKDRGRRSGGSPSVSLTENVCGPLSSACGISARQAEFVRSNGTISPMWANTRSTAFISRLAKRANTFIIRIKRNSRPGTIDIDMSGFLFTLMQWLQRQLSKQKLMEGNNMVEHYEE